MKIFGIGAIVLMTMVGASSTASASLVIKGTKAGFSAAGMDAFDVVAETGGYDVFNPGSGNSESDDAVTLNPEYSDGTTPMTGAAGATGRWNDAAANDYVEVLLGTTFSTAMDLSAATGLNVTDFRMVAHNDNFNDDWEHGLWIEAGGVITKSAGTQIHVGGSKTLTFDLVAAGVVLDDVTGYGVYVANSSIPGHGGDAFHSSWSVPEPASMCVWALMAGAGGLGFVRNRKRRVQKNA